MKFVEVDKDRFFDIMERCGAYIGDTETGYTHRKELWCRNLSVWQGETVVGVSNEIKGSVATFSVAGFLNEAYKVEGDNA